MMDKDIRKLLKAAEDQGFTWRLTTKGHPAVYRDGRLIVVGSGTASDHRSYRNFLARLRKAGLMWPPR